MQQWIARAFDFVLHIDRYLGAIIQTYAGWTYGILFLVIFIETGLVVTPFLPGDSLLFAAGAFSATGALNPWFVYVVGAIGAILGDTSNYWIGHAVGPRVFNDQTRWLRRDYLLRTRDFFDRHGKATIFLARFVPIIRTFAPFVAGVGEMKYSQFIGYNVLGGILWPALFVAGGYYFGNIPFVRNNFSLVIVAIVVISVLPVVWQAIRSRGQAPAEADPPEG